MSFSKLARDANGQAIQAVRPESGTNVTDTTYVPSGGSVLRLTSAAGASYGLAGTANVTLPAGIVEYIRASSEDTLTVSGTINVAEC